MPGPVCVRPDSECVDYDSIVERVYRHAHDEDGAIRGRGSRGECPCAYKPVTPREVDSISGYRVEEEDGRDLSRREEEPSVLGSETVKLTLELGDLHHVEAPRDGVKESMGGFAGECS
ncbi:hypothetical protein NL676_002570 [Syzygium grande]|nr:hypothetical protein NL676_002570 [Syzygium grande]